MLWEKIRGNPKAGDIGYKASIVVNVQFVAGVAVSLTIWIALLMSGGASKVMGETLVTEVELLEITKPKSIEISDVVFSKIKQKEFLEVSKPKFIQASEKKSFASGIFLQGTYARAKRENTAYLRCANLKEFNIQLECVLEALDITQEDLDKVTEEE